MKSPYRLPSSARVLVLALLAIASGAHAQAPASPGPTNAPSATSGSVAPTPPDVAISPETVLIRSGTVTLTRAEYDLELTRLPADARGGFGADPARVNALLNRMLIGKTMAARARAAGLDTQPAVQQRVAAEVERVLAAAYGDSIDAQAAKEFDLRPGSDVTARERWLADSDKYRVAEQLSVTQIVFDLSKRGKDGALRSAQEARAKILAGADMNALAMELSDDPSASRTGGRIARLARGRADAAFTDAAFALKNPGDVSEPVLTRLGYHVIRLDGRQPAAVRPFAEVKDAIVADLRNEYVDKRRAEIVMTIRTDPMIVVNEPAVEALIVRINQDDIRKAIQAQSNSPAPPTSVLK